MIRTNVALFNYSCICSLFLFFLLRQLFICTFYMYKIFYVNEKKLFFKRVFYKTSFIKLLLLLHVRQQPFLDVALKFL